MARLETRGSCHQTIITPSSELIELEETASIRIRRCQWRHCSFLDDLDDVLGSCFAINLYQGIRDRRPPWILDRSGEYPSHFKFEIHLGAACGNVAFFLRREAPGDGLEAIGEVLQTRDLIETRRVRDRHDAIFFLHILQFEQHLKPLLKRRFPLDTLLKCSDLCIRHRLAKRTENGTADRHP